MDTVDRETRSRIMSKIKSVSGIERVPEKFRHLNMRHQPDGVYGRPDFANKSRKVALFIDGCYWHFHETHMRLPKSNVEFWKAKFERNKQRDREVTERLESEGWTVIRIWECELKEME